MHVWVAAEMLRPFLASWLLGSCLAGFLAVLALLRAALYCCCGGLLLFGSNCVVGLWLGGLCLLVLLMLPCSDSFIVVVLGLLLSCGLCRCKTSLFGLLLADCALGCCPVSASCCWLVHFMRHVGSDCGLVHLLLVLVPVASRCFFWVCNMLWFLGFAAVFFFVWALAASLLLWLPPAGLLGCCSHVGLLRNVCCLMLRFVAL